MEIEALFKAYPNDVPYMEYYSRLQERYFKNARMSDLVLASLVDRACANMPKNAKVLDIGCSTGAFLYHLRDAFPDLQMQGGDLSESIIENCRTDPRLAGIDFQVMDICNLPQDSESVDIVICNAILYGFSNRLFSSALANIARVLKKGGVFLAFDFFHPYHQELEIIEYSGPFPQGHPMHMRSFSAVTRALNDAGLGKAEFMPFDLPIDLPDQGYESNHTRTVAAMDGKRLQFRGTLFQPWCHLAVERV